MPSLVSGAIFRGKLLYEHTLLMNLNKENNRQLILKNLRSRLYLFSSRFLRPPNASLCLLIPLHISDAFLRSKEVLLLMKHFYIRIDSKMKFVLI